jgi:hypothetical protein
LWQRVPKPTFDGCRRALRRSLPAIAGMALLGAIGGSGYAGYRFVTTSSRFAIDDIQIRGNHHLTLDQVRQTLPVAVGDNVFTTDLDTVVRGLRGNPWVQSAEAHRILPHTIVIEVREHEAIAIADLGGLYLVDATGHPFKRAAIDRDDGAGLPIITGLDRTAFAADPEATARLIASGLGALETWHSEGARPAIGEVHFDPHGALTLHTYDEAIAIQLGIPELDRSDFTPPRGRAFGLAARMRTFDAAWAELTESERARARAIHLDTRPDHVTVAFASQKDQ